MVETLNRVKYIEQAMEIYLNRKHMTIGMSPIECDKKKNEKDIRELYKNKYDKLKKKENLN